MCDQDQVFSCQTPELIQYSSYDEVTEVEVEEEISVHHPQSVVTLLFTEMEDVRLTDNLHQMYDTEYRIE
jgi:hypothetical protein